ncbi:methionyl-tRNA formyltransferase [Pseudothermotoga lettingae]|uniref:methionyl-tRNA formyltransferase n=1 Tax=Pseudothermotoga lettingae TaxID=177758 RepID=UPI00074650CD|nr:methionyl-tRNA formyltransferase [Pseudothermotoga lettingae]KUK20546.1 MAG: Methionyl-tRNA formyltransferase [Pseudothermotoga lettingae]
MKILFLGTPLYASRHLEALLSAGHMVIGVITQPDKPAGRGLRMVHSPVKDLALKNKIPVFESLKDFPFDRLTPDIGIVVAYGGLIKKKFLDLIPFGYYNIHPSLLPKYRGAAPINRALENGEKMTGVSLFKLTEKLDAGPIVLQVEISVDYFETFDSLENRMIEAGKKILCDFLKNPESFELREQDHSRASYAPKITPADLFVDFRKDSETVKNKIRAYDSRPGARTFFHGEQVKLFGAVAIEKCHSGEPGTIVHIDDKGAYVTTSDGIIVISQIQFPSKKKMSFLSALNGRMLRVKDRFQS